MANSAPENHIYLDYNATAPLRENARAALISAHQAPLNASSVHAFGRLGRKMIEESRTNLSAAINCPAAQITFNSGATEGNNTVLTHFARTYPNERILIGATEHPSIHDVPLANRAIIPVDRNGVIDLNALEALLKDGNKTSLVSVMLANNETGTIQPIADIAVLAHSHGALMHCDATQALGRIPVDMQALSIDLMTLSSHKVGGPQGVGALAIGLCGIAPVLLHGGGQEKKLRAGTENVAGIAGFGAAVAEASAALDTEHVRLSALQKQLENGLKSITPDVIIHAENTPRLPNTTLFSLPGAKAESLLMALDLDGLALSNGSACSSGTVKASHVLQAMQTPVDIAKAALRISTGWNTQAGDIEAVLHSWQTLAARQKAKHA